MSHTYRQLQKKLIIYPISYNLQEIIEKYFTDYIIISFEDPYDVFLGDFDTLNKISYNSKILFTSLLNYNLVNSVFPIKYDCVILETWGYDICQLIESKSINRIIYINGDNIDIKLKEIPVNPTKSLFQEIITEDDPEIKKLLTIYQYPDGLSDKPDKPVEYGGWIPENPILSPKLKALYNNLSYKEKSIVLSKFDDKYGCLLIKSILYRMGLNVTSNIDKYNDQENVILCINDVENKNIIDLDSIHIIDNYEPCYINLILRQLTMNNINNITIYIYPMLNTIDARSCEVFKEKLKCFIRSFYEIIDNSEIIDLK